MADRWTDKEVRRVAKQLREAEEERQAQWWEARWTAQLPHWQPAAVPTTGPPTTGPAVSSRPTVAEWNWKPPVGCPWPTGGPITYAPP